MKLQYQAISIHTATTHVYETLGFQKLRVNLDSWQNQLGQWESSVDYALTPEHFHTYLTGE